MASTKCDLSTIRAASKCFDCLSKTEKLALKVWFLAQALKAIDGDDLTNVNTLLSASACYKCEPISALDSFEVQIFRQTAIDVGASVDTLSISDLRSRIRCLTCADPKALLAAYIYLLCNFEAKQA